jgi:hypothetical protein
MMQEFMAQAKDKRAAIKSTENSLRLATENLGREEANHNRVLGYKSECSFAFCGHGRHIAACGTWEVCSYISLTFFF